VPIADIFRLAVYQKLIRFPSFSVSSPAATRQKRRSRSLVGATPIAGAICSAVIGPFFSGVNTSSCIPPNIASAESAADLSPFIVSGPALFAMFRYASIRHALMARPDAIYGDAVMFLAVY
jgi:hypothetical protein